MPTAREPAQWASKNASGNIVPSETRTKANSTPSAATSAQLIIGLYLETSTPLIVGPTPHTKVACSTDDSLGTEPSSTAHPATTAPTKMPCVIVAVRIK